MPFSLLHSLHSPELIPEGNLGTGCSCSSCSFLCVQTFCVISILSGKLQHFLLLSFNIHLPTSPPVTFAVLLLYFLFSNLTYPLSFCFYSLLAFFVALSIPSLPSPSAILQLSFSLHLSPLIQSLLYSPVSQRWIILNAPSTFAAFQTA